MPRQFKYVRMRSELNSTNNRLLATYLSLAPARDSNISIDLNRSSGEAGNRNLTSNRLTFNGKEYKEPTLEDLKHNFPKHYKTLTTSFNLQALSSCAVMCIKSFVDEYSGNTSIAAMEQFLLPEADEPNIGKEYDFYLLQNGELHVAYTGWVKTHMEAFIGFAGKDKNLDQTNQMKKYRAQVIYQIPTNPDANVELVSLATNQPLFDLAFLPNQELTSWQRFKQQWNQLNTFRKILAGAAIVLGIAAIVAGAIFFPPSLAVTLPFAGTVSGSLLLIIGGATLVGATAIGHAIDIVKTPLAIDMLRSVHPSIEPLAPPAAVVSVHDANGSTCTILSTTATKANQASPGAVSSDTASASKLEVSENSVSGEQISQSGSGTALDAKEETPVSSVSTPSASGEQISQSGSDPSLGAKNQRNARHI